MKRRYIVTGCQANFTSESLTVKEEAFARAKELAKQGQHCLVAEVEQIFHPVFSDLQLEKITKNEPDEEAV